MLKRLLLIFIAIFLSTCGGGGSKTTGPEEPPIVINLTSLNGQAQKGPFNNGTAINIAELTSALSPTGRNFSSAITDNTGRFAVANVQLESPYVELRANGYYFNEVSNEISSGQLTLFALSNLTGKTSLNVNIITHLEKNRMVTLMSGDSPKTFAQAKLQAQEEVFAVFDYSRANVPESELLDISQGGAANGKLLAMSAIIQGDLTVGQMSQLLANISTDIASDGTLDDASLRATLINNSKNLDMAEIRSNLVAHYSSLGVSATIPDFETEINQFLKPPVAQDMSASTAEDTAINITLAGSDPEGESLTYTILEVNNATVTLNGNVANYAPDTHFNGTDTFTYYANDGTTDSNIATVTMTVSAEDDEPNTNDVSTTTDEDVAVAINLTADEYDGQNYSFNIVSDPSNGTVSLSGTTATYTPNQDWNGTDTFTFEATDDRIILGQRNVATATITVNAINDAPTTDDIATTIDENRTARMVGIPLQGTDVDGDNLTYTVVSGPSNGDASIAGSILTYAANQDWNGTETITYKANDGTVDSNTSTITITVNSVNDVPVTGGDLEASINENTSVDFTLSATDVESTTLTFSIESSPSNGTASINSNILTYTPNSDYYGNDTFTYVANDGEDNSDISTVTISINDIPEVQSFAVTTDEDIPANLILQASDNDNNDLQYQFTKALRFWSDAESTSSHNLSQNGEILEVFHTTTGGTAVFDDSLLVFTPGVNLYSGLGGGQIYPDTLKYRAYDGIVYSDEVEIIINVNPVNDAPEVINSNISLSQDEDDNMGVNGFDMRLVWELTDPDYQDDMSVIFKEINTTGGNLNFWITPPDNNSYSFTPVVGDTIKFIDYDQDENGIIGKLSFMANENFNGDAGTFTATAWDGELESDQAQWAITVNPINDAPSCDSVHNVSTNEDESLVINLPCTDVEGDALTTVFESNYYSPENGTLSVSGTAITYTPNANYEGWDKFEYHVFDGTYQSGIEVVNINMIAVDDLPTAIDLTASTGEDDSVDITLQYEDVEGDTWSNPTYELSSSPANGTVTLNTEKTIATYTPNTGFFGTDAFNYSTEAESSVEGTVTITIHERVGTLKVYPDLGTNYNEVLSDIVYDESTGGFLAIGTTYEEGDSGGAGTYDMIALEVSSDLSKVDYRKVTELSLNGGVNSLNSLSTTTYPGGGTHHYDISKKSIDGNFLVTHGNDYVWSIDGTTGITKEQITSTWDFSNNADYDGIDYITSVTQDANGDFIIFGKIGARRNPGAGGEQYPVIAKTDANLNLKYYHTLYAWRGDDNADKQYSGITFGVAKTASSGTGDTIYGVLANVWRIGFQSSTRTTRYWTISDTGSHFNVNRRVDLGYRDINTGVDNDLCYIYEGSGSSHTTFAFVAGNELVVVTEGPNGGQWFEQGTYTLDFTNEPHIELVADVDSETNGNFYVITQKNTSNGNNRIQVYKFNASAGLSLLWNKTVGLNDDGDNNSYLEAIGGAAVDSQGNIAIVGTQIINYGDSNGNQNANGIIILLDSDGNRIY